jgi:DNA invertase Pin-like site-specific DNA recombinase
MARVLGATRLSHDTDASTSLERQREAIARWAGLKDHTIVHVTEDSDVSGAVSPFDREDLGPWLCQPKLAQWDVLAVAKLDRISRSLVDFANLLEWCQDNGKVLVSDAEGLDFGTPTGQFIGKILILFAEFERQMMRERRSDAARKLYANGGYNGGGSLPWGYRTTRRDGRIELAPDPELVEKITGIADAVIGGESVQSVAKRVGLDHANLLRRLRSPSLRGLVTYRGNIVRDDDGMPLLREPVLPAARWHQLQSRLDANSKGAGVPRDGYAWLHVLACRVCGDDLYYQRWSARPTYAYLNHKPSLQRYAGQDKKDRCRCSFRAPDVEAQIEPVVMAAFGDKYVPEIIELPAEDHTEELEQVQESIADLERDRYERGLFRGEDGTRRYAAMMTKLEARLEELKAQPVLPARREVVLSGELFRDKWEALETGRERGDLLRRMKVKLPVFTDAQGRTRVGLSQERPGAPEPPTAHQWVNSLMRS